MKISRAKGQSQQSYRLEKMAMVAELQGLRSKEDNEDNRCEVLSSAARVRDYYARKQDGQEMRQRGYPRKKMKTFDVRLQAVLLGWVRDETTRLQELQGLRSKEEE
ncbi:hypothetical protein ACLOJK_010164 [Asimina triloba]